MRPKTKFSRGTVELGAYQEKGKFDPYKIKDYEIAQLQANQEIEKQNYMRRAEEGKTNMALRFKQEEMELKIANDYARLQDDRDLRELNMLVQSGQDLVMQGVKWAKEGQANRAREDFKNLDQVEQSRKIQEYIGKLKQQNSNNLDLETAVQNLEAEGISNPFAEAIRGKGKVYAATYMELAAVNYGHHVPGVMDHYLRTKKFDTGIVGTDGQPVLKAYTEFTDKEKRDLGPSVLAEAGEFTVGLLGKDFPPELVKSTIGSAIKQYSENFAVNQASELSAATEKDRQKRVKSNVFGIIQRESLNGPYARQMNDAAFLAIKQDLPTYFTDRDVRAHIVREIVKEIQTNPKGRFAQLGNQWLLGDVEENGKTTTRMFKMKKILEEEGFWDAYEEAHLKGKLAGSEQQKIAVMEKHMQIRRGEPKDRLGLQTDIGEWYASVDPNSGLTNKERVGGMNIELLTHLLLADNPTVSDGPEDIKLDTIGLVASMDGAVTQQFARNIIGANQETINRGIERGIIQKTDTPPEVESKYNQEAVKLTNGVYQKDGQSKLQDGSFDLTRRRIQRILRGKVEEFKENRPPEKALEDAIAWVNDIASTEQGRESLKYNASEVRYDFTPENKATDIISEMQRVAEAKGVSLWDVLKGEKLESMDAVLTKYTDMMNSDATATQIRQAIAIDPVLNSATWRNKVGLSPELTVEYHLRRMGFKDGIPDPHERGAWRAVAAQVAPELADQVKANNTTFKILVAQNTLPQNLDVQLTKTLGLNKKINPEDAEQLGKSFRRVTQLSNELEKPWDSTLINTKDPESINLDIDNVLNNYGLPKRYNLDKTHPNLIRSLPPLANAYRIYLEENGLPIPKEGLLSDIKPQGNLLFPDHGDTKLGRTRLEVQEGGFAEWLMANGEQFGYKVEAAKPGPALFGGEPTGAGPDGEYTETARDFLKPGVVMTYTGSNGMGMTVPDTSLTGDLVEGIGYRGHHTLNAGNREQILKRLFRAHGPMYSNYDGVPFSQLPIERQYELLTEWEEVRLTAHSEPK